MNERSRRLLARTKAALRSGVDTLLAGSKNGNRFEA